MIITLTSTTIGGLGDFYLADYIRLFFVSLDFGVHTFVLFSARQQRLYPSLCISHKQSGEGSGTDCIHFPSKSVAIRTSP